MVDVQFTNDLAAPPEDRNLYVDKVTVNGVVRHPETGAAVLDRGDGSLAFDGVDVLPGQELLAWNGALRFVIGAGGYSAGYDANGNLSYKVKDNQGLVLVYDAENRMTAVSGSATATFVYDGDTCTALRTVQCRCGQRVKGTVGGVTTSYIGSTFEWTTSVATMKQYYYAGGGAGGNADGGRYPQLAFGRSSGPSAPPRGSHREAARCCARSTASSVGGKLAEVRYKPCPLRAAVGVLREGEDRYTSGTTPTTFRLRPARPCSARRAGSDCTSTSQIAT